MEFYCLGIGNRVRFTILVCIAFTVSGVIYFGYFCPEKVCALTSSSSSRNNINNNRPIGAKRQNIPYLRLPPSAYFNENTDVDSVPLFTPSVVVNNLPAKDGQVSNDNLMGFERNVSFDVEKGDVMVFLHIQKTGGTTFGRHLVQDVDLKRPCECRRKLGKGGTKPTKRCKCLRPNDTRDSYWLFSRLSTGWLCGLHADWTELTSCVDRALNQLEARRSIRRYFYVTMLREPVVRFLSEFLHVQRGATWKTSRHSCGGREATAKELPPCYEGEGWEDVSLEEFMGCPYNLAINRQTRMMADLALVDCYNTSGKSRKERESLMLASAKDNLRNMAYFGLCEQQQVSQYLFEETFNLRFLTTFQQYNDTHVSSIVGDIEQEELEKVRRLNHLDVQLYEYAKQLLAERFERRKRQDPDFQSHFALLGKPHQKPQFHWDDIEEEES